MTFRVIFKFVKWKHIMSQILDINWYIYHMLIMCMKLENVRNGGSRSD